MNARCSPSRVLYHHAKNQVANLFGDPLSTDPHSGSGDQFPVQSETRAVPADDGLRSDEDQRALPPRPSPPGGHPK